MKKHLFTIAAAFIVVYGMPIFNANALSIINPPTDFEDDCSTASIQACITGTTYAASCNTVNCNACKTAPITSTSNGVVTTTKQAFVTHCGSSPATCSCDTTSRTYACASGYYGTATSGTSGCTACPSNATCSGGNGSTFSCNKGYYKSGSSCTACPSDGTTSGSGATSVSSCYIPSGTSFSDGTGSGSYTGNCYY